MFLLAWPQVSVIPYAVTAPPRVHQQARVAGRTENISAASDLHNLLTLCFSYFHLTDVVRLSASKLLAQLCKEQLTADHNHLAHQLLQQALGTHAAAFGTFTPAARVKTYQHYRQVQLVSAMTWLLGQLGSSPLFSQQQNSSTAVTEATTVNTLLQYSSPFMTIRLAKRLVRSGMRVSYAQLVSAARAGVAGIEIWGQAYQQLRMESDVPEYARPFTTCSIMRPFQWVSHWNG